MNLQQIAQQRLLNQQLAATRFTQPPEVVSWMIAMQAQEFAMARWAIGLRANGLTDSLVEKSSNEGKILRTHLMRPTWHFVEPGDIRWLLKLTAPRVHALNAFYYRRAELDDKLFRKAHTAIRKALAGNKFLTRNGIQDALEKAKINASGERLICILMQAELEGLICSGPREGKQFTYALLEERVAPAIELSRSEAITQFLQRYFISRGPATLKDFCYWSGLPMKDAKEGASALSADFIKERIDGDEYFFQLSKWEKNKKYTTTFLMPDYDEYGMSYKNRSALQYTGAPLKGSTVYSHWFVVNGLIQGTWERKETSKGIIVHPIITGKLTTKQQADVETACKKYESFVDNLKLKKG